MNAGSAVHTTRWTHPVAGAGVSVLPALAAVVAFAVATATGGLAAGGLSSGAVALLAYLAMGTIAGYSVSGST